MTFYGRWHYERIRANNYRGGGTVNVDKWVSTSVSRIIWWLTGFIPVDATLLFAELGLFGFGGTSTIRPLEISISLWVDWDMEQLWTARWRMPLPAWVTYPAISRRIHDTRLRRVRAIQSRPPWFYGAYAEIEENGERFYCQDTLSNALPGKTIIGDSRGIAQIVDCIIRKGRI